MLFETMGNKENPAVLFFHAMGVTGKSSRPVAEFLKDDYYCIMPTSAVYCEGQKYISREKEREEVELFLEKEKITALKLVVASSLGADLASVFLAETKIPVEHVFFDGGQFAKINKGLRTLMKPFLYFAIKSFYWTNGDSLKNILWCDDDSIKPYFIEAGKNITFGNLSRQMSCSLQDMPFPKFSKEMQERTFFEFGSIEDHFKYRDDVMKSYPSGNYPVFENFDHMQYQIKDPEGFADMLKFVIENNKMPDLPFLRK